MKFQRLTLEAVLCGAALLQAPSGCAGATINIGPPNPPSTTGNGCGAFVNGVQRPATSAWPSNPNKNVLQAAIDAASAYDTIIMAPGQYYFECNVYIDKPLTILGACAGVPVTDAAITSGIGHTNPRAGCTATGETMITADKSFAFNGLQGIFVLSSNVKIDGLAFAENPLVTDSTWRGMINIAANNCPNKFYENIDVLNNYMVGTQISSTYPIGGNQANCILKKLKYDGNLLKVTATSAGSYEPLGVRGVSPFDPTGAPAGTQLGTHTLIDFTLTNNFLGCNTNDPPETNCQVFNLQNNYLSGTTTIAFNNLYDDDNIDDDNCPFRTTFFPIPLQNNNFNLILDECAAVTGTTPPTFCGTSILAECGSDVCCDADSNAVGPACCGLLPFNPVFEKCCPDVVLVDINDECPVLPEFCSDSCVDSYGKTGIAVCTLHDYAGDSSTADADGDHYHNYCETDLTEDITPGVTTSYGRLVVECGCCSGEDGYEIKMSKKGDHCFNIRNRKLTEADEGEDVYSRSPSKKNKKGPRNTPRGI